MTLDLLDHAFIDRWRSLPAVPPSGTVPAAMVPATPPVRTVAAPATIDLPAAPLVIAADHVDRLLEAAPDAWAAVADEVEAARGRGRRVIAVVACERGTGATTLVAGLARLLEVRGRDVVCVARSGAALPADGPTHDRRIVLVDAGVWFPPGRIHRQRVAVASAGCDAAILVRRADRESPAAWSAVLEAFGVEPLGEVVAFAAPPGVDTMAGVSS